MHNIIVSLIEHGSFGFEYPQMKNMMVGTRNFKAWPFQQTIVAAFFGGIFRMRNFGLNFPPLIFSRKSFEGVGSWL